MSTGMVGLVVIIAVSLVALVGMSVWLGFRSQDVTPGEPPASPDMTSIAPLFDLATVTIEDGGAESVLVQELGDGSALIFGSDQAVECLAARGKPSEPIPRQLTQIVAGTRPLAEGAKTAGEMSGRLVWLSKESAMSLKSGQAMKGAGRYVRALVVDPKSKQIQKIIQIRPATLVTSGLAATNILCGIAMQVQMAQIEASLARIEGKVDDLLVANRITRRAKLDAAELTLQRVYSQAMRSGSMTTAQWIEIANRGYDLTTTHFESVVTVRHLADKLNDRSVKGRLEYADDVTAAILPEAMNAVDAARNIVRFEMLRVWYLTAAGDATAVASQEDLPGVVRGVLGRTEEALAYVRQSLEMDELGWFTKTRGMFSYQKMHRSLDAARERTEAVHITPELDEAAERMERTYLAIAGSVEEDAE